MDYWYFTLSVTDSESIVDVEIRRLLLISVKGEQVDQWTLDKKRIVLTGSVEHLDEAFDDGRIRARFSLVGNTIAAPQKSW